MKKSINMLVACVNANGEPDLARLTVLATDHEQEHGEHYEKARSMAQEDGYEPPFICYDEADQRNIFRVMREIQSEQDESKRLAFNSLESAREESAQQALEEADFEINAAAEMSGWERSGCEWVRNLFFDNPDGGDSILKSFKITFADGSSQIKNIEIE